MRKVYLEANQDTNVKIICNLTSVYMKELKKVLCEQLASSFTV